MRAQIQKLSSPSREGQPSRLELYAPSAIAWPRVSRTRWKTAFSSAFSVVYPRERGKHCGELEHEVEDLRRFVAEAETQADVSERNLMGWGNPLGFSSGKTPFELICTAAYGESGWYFCISGKPRPGLPRRARVTFPCGWATFDSADDAQRYLGHPGDVPVAARAYLAWLDGGPSGGSEVAQPSAWDAVFEGVAS